MNETETPTPAPEESSGGVASLQRQITFLLIALIVISGTLTSYLYYQARVLGHEIAGYQPQARVVIENYKKNLPHIEKFVQALVAYGQKHPDFQPILKKYRIPLTIPAATNSVSARPIAPPASLPKK